MFECECACVSTTESSDTCACHCLCLPLSQRLGMWRHTGDVHMYTYSFMHLGRCACCVCWVIWSVFSPVSFPLYQDRFDEVSLDDQV